MHSKGFPSVQHRGGPSLIENGRGFGGGAGNVAVNRRRNKELSEDQKQEIKDAFELFDEHHSGRVDYHELKTILKAFGFDVTKQQVLEALKPYDPSGSGFIQYADYVALMTEKFLSRDPAEEFALAFKLFDDDNTGTITFKNLRRVANELGEELGDEELKAMIDEFDRDQDGAIDLQDFEAIMRQAHPF